MFEVAFQMAWTIRRGTMRFFVLKSPKLERRNAVTDYFTVEGSTAGKAPRCPACGGVTGLLPIVPPIFLEIETWGSRWGDIAFGPGDYFLVSERLRNLFQESGLTGVERFEPVEIVKTTRRSRMRQNPPVYHLASIKRSRAAIDDAASGLDRERTPECQECRFGGLIKRAARIVLEPGTWSGEDVFIARGLPGTILASERFKRLCDEAALANCGFIPAEEYSFDFYPNEHASPIVH